MALDIVKKTIVLTAGQTFNVKIVSIDDRLTVLLNQEIIRDLQFGALPPSTGFELKDKLKPGDNFLYFIGSNSGGPSSYGFEIEVGGNRNNYLETYALPGNDIGVNYIECILIQVP
jgi:hypothetical protein